MFIIAKRGGLDKGGVPLFKLYFLQQTTTNLLSPKSAKADLFAAFEEMRKKYEETVAELPEKIRLAEEAATKIADEKTRAVYAMETKLKTQEWQAEKMMQQAKIDALSDTAKSQVEEIKSLKTALTNANQQAQTLAATVVESMAGGKNAKTLEGENK